MFGQLLGRYSTTITTEIAAHPTVRLLQRFTLAVLVGLYLSFLLGFPDGLPQATVFLVTAILSCLVLTVLVANKGYKQISHAIRGRTYRAKGSTSFGDTIAKPSWFGDPCSSLVWIGAILNASYSLRRPRARPKSQSKWWPDLQCCTQSPSGQ